MVTGADGAPLLSSVSRTSTGSGPGSASAIVPVHPSPPPCGHSHTLETAVPRTAAAGASGPARSAAMPPTTTKPATASARTPRPILLIGPIRSSSDRLPGDPQRGHPDGGEHPDRDRAWQLRAVPDGDRGAVHRERGCPPERPSRLGGRSLQRPRIVEL